MKANNLYRSIPILVLVAVALSAQTARDIPLKNWSAPEFWQPTVTEAEAAKTNAATHAVKSDALPASPSSANSLVFVAMTPCRVVDTRASQMFPAGFGAPSMTPGPARSFPIQSSTLCSIPSIAQAYSFNMTLVPPGPVGYLIVWPTGQAQPNAVTMDDITGDIRNNAAIIPAGTPNGSISAVVNANTDLVIDINGYYAPPVGLTIGQGTAAAPALSFSGDPGTGIFSAGMGLLNLSAGGNNGLTLDSTGDVNVTGGIQTSRSVNMIFPPVFTGDFPGGSAPTPAQGDSLSSCGSARPWMIDGMFLCWDTDLMYVGLKDQGSDRKDAVIAWGDNPTSDANVGAGPDVLRFIFAGRRAFAPLQEGLADGLEVARFTPEGNFGIGTTWSYPANPPANTLDVNGTARIRNLLGTGTALVTAESSGVLHSLGVGPANTFLANNLTWATPAGGGGGNVSSSSSCAANLLTKWLTGVNIVGCSEITDTGSKVGIDNTSPVAKLDVKGDVSVGDPAGPTKYHYQILNNTVLSIDGTQNVLVGAQAGSSNTGTDNTFTGFSAGQASTGNHNTCVGSQSCQSSNGGGNNTITGWTAGQVNTGGANSIYGAAAGRNNAGGINNSFFGFSAGMANQTGSHNTYVGNVAGTSNIGGSNNVCVGDNSCGSLTSGSGNLALGTAAGQVVTSGDNNIYLNYYSPTQSATESNTIRIGTPGTQTAAYFAGIFGQTAGSGQVPVLIGSNGQLGTIASSRRFKENIQDMGEGSSLLSHLRPVTFFYKPQFDDGSHLLQYGLIAEEVAQVYPEMVVYDKDGAPLTVKYQLLAPMLLNELQKQQAVTQELQQRLARLEALIANK